VIPNARRALGFRSLIDVPIHNRQGQLLGCFELHNKENGQPFDEADQQMLEGLAASAAIALENAQMLEERAEAEAALKSANSANDRFLATLSHELRTPLTPVLAQVTALEKEARLPEDLRPELRMVRRNVELESRLIDDLLSLFGGRTRPVMAHLVESGKLTMDDVREAQKALRAMARKEKGK
jgi:GAF domain-containing protein